MSEIALIKANNKNYKSKECIGTGSKGSRVYKIQLSSSDKVYNTYSYLLIVLRIKENIHFFRSSAAIPKRNQHL